VSLSRSERYQAASSSRSSSELYFWKDQTVFNDWGFDNLMGTYLLSQKPDSEDDFRSADCRDVSLVWTLFVLFLPLINIFTMKISVYKARKSREANTAVLSRTNLTETITTVIHRPLLSPLQIPALQIIFFSCAWLKAFSSNRIQRPLPRGGRVMER